MNNKQSTFIVFLFCSVLMGACATQSQETAIPAPPSLPSPTVRPTIPASSTPGLTLRPTLIPTATLAPEEVSALATYTALISLCEHTVDLKISPDGEWVANACTNSDGSNRYARIVRLDKSAEWTIPFNVPGEVQGHIFPIHWSLDGKALYLTPHVTGEGNGLLKLDLNTGDVTEILPFNIQAQGFYSFSFSPDDNSLAYVYNVDPPLELSILKMPTNDLVEIPLNETILNADTILWSDDGMAIVYTGKINKDFVLVWLNLTTFSEKIFAAPEKTIIEADHWVDTDTILVKNRADKYWLLDLESGEFEVTSP